MLDEHMDILSNVHRRRLLIALARENPQNDGTNPTSWKQSHRERAVLMQHVHLPKLEDYGYIDWNRISEQVTKGPQFDEIKPLLTLLVENQEILSDASQQD